ncbi:MAG: glycosyltransferase family 4 protein [Ignavibacteriaceae bacterium]
MKVTIIYPVEPSYIYGLIDGLSKNDIEIDLIGSDRMKSIENKYPNVNLVNLRGSQDHSASAYKKFLRLFKFYVSLLFYVIRTDSKLIHLHWPNKYFVFDSTFLPVFYKIMGKKIVYTAHNIDQGMRDKKVKDRKKVYNFLYNTVDHIIVHNHFSFRVLKERFNIPDSKISIEKMGIIKAPSTGISSLQARNSLNLSLNKKIILFFGGINPYKGLDLLLQAFIQLAKEDDNYFLLIAGQPRDNVYFDNIKVLLNQLLPKINCFANFGFVPYEDVEKYFMAADCIAMPYRYIFQSAVHALSFSYGLPIIATDVGSFREEDIIEGFNGFICDKIEPISIKETIVKYFNSDLYTELDTNRVKIIKWAEENYSWDTIGKNTLDIYLQVLNK